MKTIEAYEFKDLSKQAQDRLREQEVNSVVEVEIEALSSELERGEITEETYYNTLGCDKNYAETTSWFIPACYYEKHQKEVDEEVERIIDGCLYSETGSFIERMKS